jgi:hypothetical protein
MLMAMERNLDKRSGEPMLFAIYGRGRVMPPGIGKEVTADSLKAAVGFLAGRCSCTVKDQNPGLDLLVKWDWEATSEKFAKEDEAAAKSEPLYREVAAGDAPKTPGDSAVAAKGASTVATAEAKTATRTPAPVPPQKAPADGQHPPADKQSPAAPGAEPVTMKVGPIVVQKITDPDPNGDSSPRSFIARQAWGLGLGLAALAVVVIGCGLVLVRKRNHGSS